MAAGGGVVVAAKLDKPPAAMLIIQSKDEKLLKQFATFLISLTEKELARQESKETLRKTNYQGIETIRLGKQLNVALADGALLLASEEKILKGLLDRRLGKEQGETIAQSAAFNQGRKDVPASAHVWSWLNLEAVHRLPNFKTGFEAGAQDPNVTILFGGLIDIVKRSPYLTAYLAQDAGDWRLRVQMPRGREGMSGIANMVLPRKDAGSLPLLQPPRTFASVSYFIDLGEFWVHREQIFNKKQVEGLEQFEKQSGKFLGGVKLGTLLQQLGNHQRVVFATPSKPQYKTQPATQIPAFAVVLDMRDPAFGKSMSFILRAAALLGSFASKSGLKMVEEEHAGHKLVSYSFPEDKTYEGDPNGIRFNFTPCFVQVGDQFVLSSTVELGKDLIDEIKRGSKDTARPATMRTQLYSSGAAQALRTGEEQVLMQLILSQALPPGAARDEVGRIIALVERLGILQFEVNYGEHDFRFDVNWQAGK
jgi:hypothetical protein